MKDDYNKFLETKEKSFIDCGFEASDINKNLFEYQKYVVNLACQKGRFALFEDCGLGKTIQFLAWSEQVVKETNKAVLILSPLAVVQQTIKEGIKFGIEVQKFNVNATFWDNAIYIINYDQLKNIDTSIFGGVVLDESSILKGRDGKLSKLIIEAFSKTPYRLACTATPSPNDHMELGQHAQFLGAMSYLEMLAMYFVHDGGETSKWRLRKHAQDDFWKFVCTWSISIDNPRTLGYDMKGYDLPEIEYVEHIIPVENLTQTLFTTAAVSATDLNKDLRRSMDDRVKKATELVNSNNEQWIVWGLQNKETDLLNKSIEDAVNVQGSDKPQTKADRLLGFADNDFRVLVTKTSIASFGMNYQNCSNMVFCSYDFKFEAFYQAVRRCYRFGQDKKVTVHLLIPESQKNVRRTILEKEKKHKKMISEMSKYSAEHDYKASKGAIVPHKEVKTDRYHLINGDCVEASKKLKTDSADVCVFSPPFAELYVYSDKAADMGNVKNYKEFEKHFQYLIPQIKRVLKPGRICAIHCMDLPIQKGKEGFIGLRDFSGMLIKWFIDQGFIYHARTTIWKNPVTEMQRTKALGLLHKTIKKDSSMSRVGIPDYVLFFRNAGDNETPITHQGDDMTKADYLPVDLWQKYASPVWMDVDYRRTLQYRSARDGNDEKHIFSPFGGIGSEGYAALKMKRKSISIELKESYFNLNAKNHRDAIIEELQTSLF
jgi:superfamily II DNA or RNA helicase